jgi:hypothetical protein
LTRRWAAGVRLTRADGQSIKNPRSSNDLAATETYDR